MTTDETARSWCLSNGQRVRVASLAPGLYIVATPIGNLRDITLRALETLAAADVIACEDTRVTRVLTRHYGISTPLIAYHEHNAARQRPRLLASLAGGKIVALVSDAGTPLVSDPGYRLVQAALEGGHPVAPVPGASAPLAALVASGLPSDTFLFAGFLPTKAAARRQRIEALADVPATLVFFDSPRRLADSLAMLSEILGPRSAAVAREITKRFETFHRGALDTLAQEFAREMPKGEIAILVAPPATPKPTEADIDSLLRAALVEMSVSAAAGQVARITGRPRRELYAAALKLTERI